MRSLSLVWLLATACAAPLAQRGVAERPWLVARSTHFVLFTDVDRPAAEAAVRGLEEKSIALLQAYARLVATAALPSRTTEVVLFARCREMPAVLDDIAGMVVLSNDFRDERQIVTCGQSGYAEETMLHELAHVLNAHLIGLMPVWLNEGLASYAQTLAVDGGELVLGRTQVSSVYLRAHRSPLSLGELLTARFATFYGPSRSLYYQAAQSLVHLLASSREGLRGRFGDYLRRLVAGEDRAAAWSAAFAGVPLAALDAELRGYHLGPPRPVRRLPYAAPPPPVVTVRPLRPGDAAALVVSLALRAPRLDRAARLATLEDAARRDPGWPDLALWRAIVELAAPRPDRAAALRLLREHAARRPDDERARSGILTAETAGTGYGTDLVADPRSLEGLEADVGELARIARGPSALNNVAWFHAQRRQPAAGLPLAERAVAQDPTNPLYQDTLALLLFQSGRVAEALRLQERAVQSYGERAPKGMVERLALFRRAAGGDVEPSSP